MNVKQLMDILLPNLERRAVLVTIGDRVFALDESKQYVFISQLDSDKDKAPIVFRLVEWNG